MSQPLLKVVNLRKWFPLRRSISDTLLRKPRAYIKAVDGISFEIMPGEIFTLAGESGCGKTTTGRLTLKLEEPDSGQIVFEGRDISKAQGDELKEFRKKAQIIFQDPYESLNPLMKVVDIVTEPLVIHALLDGREEKIEAASKALEMVALTPPENFLYRFPHELSGGQRQRVAIARTLVLKPQYIVADEPVSMLDVSIRASILKLLLEIREKFGVAYLFITHDLALAKHISDRIAIMYLGKIVEMGDSEKVLTDPAHPYTKALIAALPSPDPHEKIGELPIIGEVVSAANPPPGCRFHPRCPYAMEKCRVIEPPLIKLRENHVAACHIL
ncbi:MAG: ABC transporter ATP-binding protein [Thermofilaceae archaeon]